MPVVSNCEDLVFNGVLSTADPDVAGTGVVTAFMISAYGTFVLVLLAYAFGLVDDSLLGPVDRVVFRIRPRHAQHPLLYNALRKAVLTLSDQQIVTGIAVMGAAFQGLRTGKISVYHYQVALFLAWLSSSVHLSALTLLSKHLEHYPAVKVWRLVGMAVLLVLLIIGLVPTVSTDWGIVNPNDPDNIPAVITDRSGWGVPAVCFWGQTYGDGTNDDAPIAYLLLVLSYWWKMGDALTSNRGRSAIIAWPFNALISSTLTWAVKMHKRSQAVAYLWAYRTLLFVYMPMLVILEIFSSFSASLWLSAIGLIFGTYQILIPRSQNAPLTGAQENSMGFGQLVPLILLVQPIGAVTEELRGVGSREQRSNPDARMTFVMHDFHDSAKDKTSLAALLDEQGEHKRVWRRSGFVDDLFTDLPSRVGDGGLDAKMVRETMLKYRTNALLIILLHVAFAVGAVIVFIVDAAGVGRQRGGNWFFVAVVIACYWVACWVFLLLCIVTRGAKAAWRRIPRREPERRQ